MSFYVRNDKGKRTKRLIYLGLSVYLTCLLVSGLLGRMGLIANLKLQSENREILKEISRLEGENKLLRREADDLLGNPRYIEKIAREELNLSRDNEIVFIFPTHTDPPDQKAPNKERGK